MDVFEIRARQHFHEMIQLLLQHLKSLFPTCEETSDALTYYNGVVKNDEKKFQQSIDDWYTHLVTPLKNIKYAKAIERITGQPACVFHACAYRDIKAIEHSTVSPMAKQLNLMQKIESGTLTEDDKKVFWRYIDFMNQHCFESKGVPMPAVPSRSDIQNNINSRRNTSTDNGEPPSMASAFQQTFASLCGALKVPSTLGTASEDEVTAYIKRWSKFAASETDGVTQHVLCSREDPRALSTLSSEFPEFKDVLLSQNDLSTKAEIWKLIGQLNSYSTVTEKIPSKMMGRIEHLANRLADDLVSGKKDFSQMNLNDIGQEVLAGCDEHDMSKFAENIEDILPALQGFSARPT